MSCGSLNVSLVCGVCSQVDSLNVWVYTRRRRSRIVRQTFLYQVMWHHVTSLRPTADVLYRRRRRRFFNISTCPEIKFDAVSHQSSWSLMCRFKLITWLHQSGSDRYDTPAPPAGHAELRHLTKCSGLKTSFQFDYSFTVCLWASVSADQLIDQLQFGRRRDEDEPPDWRKNWRS